MARITMATVKSFIRKNEGKLYIMSKSAFDGQIDGCFYKQNPQFTKALKPEAGRNHENCLGVQGAWFVFGSRDHLSEFNKDGFVGISVYNSCGSFVLAIEK